jgi:hypothetical protein
MKNAMTMILLAVAITLSLCGGAWAEQTWLCSIGSAVAVDEDGTVGPPDLGDKDRPTFFRVDPTKKELTLLAPASRRGEVTKINMVHESQGQRIFSGVENGRSLNLIIADDGRMSLSVLGDGVVWSVFGNALPEGETKAALVGETKTPPKSDADTLPEGEPKAAAEGEAKTSAVERDLLNASSGTVICPSVDGGVATSLSADYRSHAVAPHGATRCKLVRRK